MNQSAASAASLDSVKFQAVIKSAASAASRKTKNQGPRSRGAHGRRLGLRTTGLGGSPGSWSLIFGLPGGCASSRLDHGLKFYGIRGGCAGSRLMTGFLGLSADFLSLRREPNQCHEKSSMTHLHHNHLAPCYRHRQISSGTLTPSCRFTT